MSDVYHTGFNYEDSTSVIYLMFLVVSRRQEEVRPQDTVSVIGGVAGSSKQGRKAAWKFVKDNWEELYNRYQGGFLISRLIKVTRGRSLTPEGGGASVDLLSLCLSVFFLFQLTVDGFAIDKMAAEVKVSVVFVFNIST